MPQPPNLQKMLAEAQAMLAAAAGGAGEAQGAEGRGASTGGGMVKVVMTGDLRLESLVIDPDAVDPEDVEMLQDMVVAAVNEAIRMAEELQQSQMGGAEGGRVRPDQRARVTRPGWHGRPRRRRRRAPAGLPGEAPPTAPRGAPSKRRS